MTDDRPDAPLPHDGWRRLHPLSPVARVGRLVPALVFLFLVSTVHSKAENSTVETDYLIVITLVSVVYGYVHWMVTRWRFEGDTLRIETGLIRKDSRRLPLARIQAVDIVRPLLARMLGVSELRIRLAGSGSTDGKLAYLAEAEAAELRLVLLAGHHDTEAAVSSNTGLPMASVTTGRLLGSVLLSLVSIVLIGTVATLAVLDQFEPRTAAAAAGFLAVYLLSFAGVVWRRLSGQYGFIAVEGPEGVRIRRGLLQTISETVPYGRIQAVRQVEPLLWRPFGWCRLEVDIAGATARNQRGEGTSVVRKALLPVGSQQDAWHLLARLLGGPDPVRTPPPWRARFKAPLSFHFLSAGHDGAHAVCVTGRLNRATTWVPLEKSQSIRRVQGPRAAAARAGHRPRRRGGEAGPGRVQGPGGGRRRTAWSRSSPSSAGWPGCSTARHRPRPTATRTSPLQAGTPTRRAGTSSATGTRAGGPSTSPTGGGAARRRLRRRREAHREVVDGADARRVDEGVAGLDLVVGDPLVPFPQRDPQLQPGQVRAEAAVDAAAEGDVAVDLAVEAHHVGVGELGLVGVGRADHDHDLVPLVDRAPGRARSPPRPPGPRP